ncbi:MAG: glycosyltransferase [Pseudomonadota bacterium]
MFNSVRHSALALRDAGLSVDVLSIRDGFTDEDLSAWDPLAPYVAGPVGPGALGLAPSLGGRLRDGGYDVVHQHGIWQAYSMQVGAWHKRTGRPYMISPRGMLDEWAIRNSAWKKKLSGALFEHRHLRRAACLHALNRSEADSIRSLGYDQPIAIIPNGADLPDPATLARPAGWPEGKVLLFIGRLHPKKGIMELIEAWSMLEQARPGLADEWSLVIAGWDDGGHEAVLRETIAERGLGGRVVMPGSLFGDEKRAALSHASAFVLPSYSEGLPMSVLEAWAYRLPVLMTEACNIPEGFADGAAVRIETDPAAMCGQLAEALGRDGEALAGMGARGRLLVERRFSWPSIAARHMEVYRWMTAGCPAGDRPDCIV